MSSGTELKLSVHAESWPIEGHFRIARGAKRSADVVIATLTDGETQGRGECVPYPRYGESTDSVMATIRDYGHALDRSTLHDRMPPGAARNAVDCALWDWQAKHERCRVWELDAVPDLCRHPRAVPTVMTIGLDTASAMAENAARHVAMPLKIKLGETAAADIDRLRAIRAAVPTTSLIVDVNEGWDFTTLVEVAPIAADLGIELIEQPLPAADDAALADFESPVAIGADESFHTVDDLATMAARYQAINIKLDKTGGLTAAIDVLKRARELDIAVMVGCMVATSLSMAPATLLAANADFVDLDGPLLLLKDRQPGIDYTNGNVHPPETHLWG